MTVVKKDPIAKRYKFQNDLIENDAVYNDTNKYDISAKQYLYRMLKPRQQLRTALVQKTPVQNDTFT